MPDSPEKFNRRPVKKRDDRKSSAARGYGYRWQQYRRQYLALHPLCVLCECDNKTVPATVVDHIKPHRGKFDLFWDTRNHQPLCKSCHDRKTVLEDGGFGNRRK